MDRANGNTPLPTELTTRLNGVAVSLTINVTEALAAVVMHSLDGMPAAR